jgi:hypothetical protein
MGDGDEGCVLDVRPEIPFAKDAALISHIVQQDDLAVCRDGASEVLTAQRCLTFWRQASGERQGCGQLVEQIHRGEGIVDHQAAKAGSSAFSSGALSGFQFLGNNVANSAARDPHAHLGGYHIELRAAHLSDAVHGTATAGARGALDIDHQLICAGSATWLPAGRSARGLATACAAALRRTFPDGPPTLGNRAEGSQETSSRGAERM